MRVAAKFGLAYFLASCSCLTLYGYVEAHRAASSLAARTEADLATLGSDLADAIGVIEREDGEAAAERVLRASAGARSDVAIELARGPLPAAAPDGVEVRVPVHGRSEATLVLRRPTTDERTLVTQMLRDEISYAVGLAIVGGVLAFVLGNMLIGRPLGRIVAQARRVGAGDFSERLEPTATDEIGALKRELNTMCDRLEAASTKLREETSARLETLEQLRHLDRLRTVGTMASSIAHELGTPLNVLLLRGRSLAAGDLSGQEIAASGNAVVAQVEKMSRIVRQLLDFSRKKAVEPAEANDVDLGALARHACGLLESLAKRHRVTIELRADDAPRVRGHFGPLEQALTNLIVNGIQSMKDGGVLRVRCERDGDDALVHVTDEGAGISAEDLPMIFDPFFTTKPEGTGTGLGLPVARGILEEHGGTLVATANPGKGTTFTMKLPRVS